MTEDAVPAPGLVALDRRVLTLWRIRGGFVVAVAAVLIGAIAVAGGGPIAGAVGVVVPAAAGGLLVWAWTAAVWRAWRFEIGDTALHLRHGVLTRRESAIPLHRVQHIDLEAGPLERRLGLTTFVLRTAAAGSDSTVPGIDAAEAGDVRSRILTSAGRGDAI